MSEPLVIQTLTQKRAEILGRIRAYEAQIAQAKHDLAHLNATMELFAAPDRQRARYMVSHGFFKKGEIADICARHLDVDGEMTTRELAERVRQDRHAAEGRLVKRLRGLAETRPWFAAVSLHLGGWCLLQTADG